LKTTNKNVDGFLQVTCVTISKILSLCNMISVFMQYDMSSLCTLFNFMLG